MCICGRKALYFAFVWAGSLIAYWYSYLLGRGVCATFGIYLLILCCPALLKAFARHGVHNRALDRVSRRRRSIDADLDPRGLNP